tara:strand:+ start:885 stop:1238 length:354 start_codon:yes stop_codon:yes gene_type:complete
MLFVKIGILCCALSVIIGAFGAHSLESAIADKMETFKTGVQYQIFHGLGLILIGILSKVFGLDLSMSGYLMIVGIVLFSGSLYLISIYKYSFMGMIAPLGGLSFIISWVVLLFKINN